MKGLLSTKEVAALLQVNEKMVYSLIADKGLPATKVTGKWLFPRHLVEQWVENTTINFPENAAPCTSSNDVLVLAGSNDPLLDALLGVFNRQSNTLAVFANVGSMGGVHALRKNLCHIAASHLMEEGGRDYNFEVAQRELAAEPVVVNFCKRHQGLVVSKGNPKKIHDSADIGKSGVRLVNRRLGTGTRLLLDTELVNAGLVGSKIEGYDNEVSRHIDVGLEVLAGRADVGPCIENIASKLDLDFLPLCWERFDLLINKSVFFEKSIQAFLSVLHEEEFRKLADEAQGYDFSTSGNMLFQGNEKGQD